MNNTPSPAGSSPACRSFLILLAVLLVALAALFHRSFQANQVLYSNDGPLGLISAKAVATTPGSFFGVWYDLNWTGNEAVTPAPTFSAFMAMILKPLGYAKFSVPLALLAIGLSAWLFFRQLRLAPVACVLGGIAAALNSDFFSTACWGVVADASCAAACYLALAAIARASNHSARWPWLRAVLAGVAVGMAVMEGYDVGALFSLFVAAYVLYQALFLDERDAPIGRKLGWGAARVVLVAAFAGFTASHVLTSLVGTQISGVSAAKQDEETRKMEWAVKTEWSLPKMEIFQVLVPGVFGYRNVWHMYDDEQPKEDQYWGLIGDNGGGFFRLSGTGLYAGVLVVVVALWTALQAFRKKGSPYSLLQRRAILFWAGALLVAMLLGFGRYAPFYQFFYALPYASTIRNPTKFMHIFSWILVIIFAYGVHGLAVAYLQNPAAPAKGPGERFKHWWAKAVGFERKWLIGCAAALAVSLMGCLIYASSGAGLQSYLATVGINPADAPGVASFSLQTVGWFVLFLVLTLGLLAAIFSGQFAGPRAKWAGGLMGLLLLVDLGRANRPWMVYFDTDFKYRSDPIVNFLADKPYEHRVSFLPWGTQNNQQQLGMLHAIYGTAWVQHMFWYENVQCLDMAQESRIGDDKAQFINSLRPDPQHNPPGLLRYWELTNTRYLLGQRGAVQDEKLFRTATFPDGKPVTFDLALKQPRLGAASSGFVAQPKADGQMAVTEYIGTPPNPGVITNYTASSADFIALPNPNGQLAITEFLEALPRASLYANWRAMTNDQETLQAIGSPGFAPHQIVLVSDAIAAPDPANAAKPAGDVQITEYEPKRIKLEANAAIPSVLLLCDRYNPKWEVSVDGQPAKLLKCNFVSRGVQVPAGKHSIEFRYHPPITTLYASLAGLLIGLVLCGLLAVSRDREEPAAAVPAAAPTKGKPAKA